MKSKKRLDQLVLQKAPALSRRRIQDEIAKGNVRVDGVVVTKPGVQFFESSAIECNFQEQQFVGRAGLKLQRALDHFAIDVTDLVVLDAGLSTGGFTDCLLQRGVQKIYGVDVGHSQVHELIKNDPRVIVMERTNLRTLKTVGELVDLITLDLSFISVLKVMDAVIQLLKPDGKLIVLIKPQFETEPSFIGKGGIIKDSKIHEQILKEVTNGIAAHGFALQGTIESPILGGDGNKEFLAYFLRK
jgi:23S rRNA (cytidine1920-2'-O)/16S rRNA (cytidine1409-2'-O)-methyltransferase